MGAVPGDLGWSRRMLWMHWVAAGTHSCAAPAGYSVPGTSQSRMGKELPAQAPRPFPLPLEAALVLNTEKAAWHSQAPSCSWALLCRATPLSSPEPLQPLITAHVGFHSIPHSSVGFHSLPSCELSQIQPVRVWVAAEPQHSPWQPQPQQKGLYAEQGT